MCRTQTPPAQSNICLSVIGRRLCFTEWGCSRFRSTKRPHSAGAMQLYCMVRQLSVSSTARWELNRKRWWEKLFTCVRWWKKCFGSKKIIQNTSPRPRYFGKM